MTKLENILREGNPASDKALEQLIGGFSVRAEQEGLLDVAYTTTDTPIGELLLATTPQGLVRVSFPTESQDSVLEEIAKLLSPRLLRSPKQLDEVRRELDEYFSGRRHHFDLKVNLALSRGFRRKVLEAANEIEYGDVATYREVATAAGSPAAVRAAGSALATNPVPIVIPCHRVVRTGKGLGGYGGGLDIKVRLLELEGVDPAGF